MKRLTTILAIILFAMTFSSCGSGGGSGSGSGSGSSNVTVNVGGGSSASSAGGIQTASIPSTVSSIRFTISAPDMTTITRTVSVAGQSSISESFNIPNGSNRRFLVEALNSSGTVLYRGEETVNLNGSTVTLGIALSAVSVSALTVAERVSVVDAESSSPSIFTSILYKLLSYITPSTVPSDSAYSTDTTTVFVEERSAEVFDIINEIMCMMAQSQYDNMVNLGNYIAQVDKNQCSQNSDNAQTAGQSSQNQSSGSTAPDYEKWTINSARADSSSSHIVKVWIHEEGNDYEPAKVIFVKATITEGTSATNPYGLFIMYFIAHPETGGVVDTSTIIFKGFLKSELDSGTGNVLLKFIVDGGFGSFDFNEAVVLNRSADGSSGSGTTSLSDTYVDNFGDTQTKTANFNFAFDSSYFRRYNRDTADDKCYSRSSFDETVWRYGLYNSTTGARIELNSGFPIKTAGGDYGWIGYYGLWFPETVTVNNGDTVYKVEYSQSGETATPYTVLNKGGKLKKYTRGTTTLANIKSIPLDGWMEGSTNYRVKWDATAQQFVKFAQFNATTYLWENITEAAIDLSTLQFGELNFYSQALGGQVRVQLTCTGWDVELNIPVCSSPTNSTTVVTYTEDPVFPGDAVPSSLRCFDNCPKYSLSAGGISGSDPFYASDYNPDATGHDYTFSSAVSDMVLKDGGNSLLMSGSSAQYQWGVTSGPLFNPTAANLALLDCNWDGDSDPATNPGTCGWKAWSVLSEYYTWETGPNAWNQFTALVSGSTPLEFVAPLQVLYTHAQSNISAPDYKYNGAKFYLEYSGFGNLWGIPGKCVDPDTGAAVNCTASMRWIPEFSIVNGAEVTNTSDNSTTYLVKALEKEQRMSNVTASLCSSLTITTYTLPLISDWVDPAIGSEPVVSNAPAVVGGVVQ